MKTWIYPGSFDPFTIGHLDVVERAAKLCDGLIVAVLPNDAKQTCFSVADRIRFIEKSTVHLPNVKVMSHEGLMAEFYNQQKANAVVKGIRNAQDLMSEFEQATVNRLLNKAYETVWIPCQTAYLSISSSVVKAVGRLGGALAQMVPPAIVDEVQNRLYPPQK